MESKGGDSATNRIVRSLPVERSVAQRQPAGNFFRWKVLWNLPDSFLCVDPFHIVSKMTLCAACVLRLSLIANSWALLYPWPRTKRLGGRDPLMLLSVFDTYKLLTYLTARHLRAPRALS